MRLQKMVVAYDGSACSQKALEWAVGMAGISQAELSVVTVLSPVTTAFMMNPEGVTNYSLSLMQASEQGLRKLLSKAADYCRQQGLTVTTLLRHGNPVDEVIACAKENEADLIVCGTRGLGGVEGLLLGSVANRLVTFSKIPVTVVK